MEGSGGRGSKWMSERRDDRGKSSEWTSTRMKWRKVKKKNNKRDRSKERSKEGEGTEEGPSESTSNGRSGRRRPGSTSGWMKWRKTLRKDV